MKEKPTVTLDTSRLLWVDIREAKPNPMFTEGLRQTVRFLVYNRKVKCAACGKRKKVMWTMLCQFTAGDFEASHFELKMFPKTFDPLTPVCDDHPLGLPKDLVTEKKT
jgi:hypothetical protein